MFFLFLGDFKGRSPLGEGAARDTADPPGAGRGGLREGETSPLEGSFCIISNQERCPSGRRSTPGERVYASAYPEFESLPLRHFSIVDFGMLIAD